MKLTDERRRAICERLEEIAKQKLPYLVTESKHYLCTDTASWEAYGNLCEEEKTLNRELGIFLKQEK